jgi:Mrp family chromosome partitioning ATPase
VFSLLQNCLHLPHFSDRRNGKISGIRMIITVASNAQSVGKTLIATNVAVLRILAGHRVRLVDITPQKTSFQWCIAVDI